MMLRNAGRPHDIDALGLLTAGLIVAGAWLLGVAPLRRAQAEHQSAQAAWERGVTLRDQRVAALREVEAELTLLRDELAARLDRLPPLRQWNDLVTTIVDRARVSGLMLNKVQPGSPRAAGLAAFGELELGGSGEVAALLTFLDQLTGLSPGAQVRSLSIQAPGPTNPDCRISLNVRLPLLHQRPNLEAEAR